MSDSNRDDLDRENARLLAQADLFSSDQLLLEEADRWRSASPERRLEETWRLCALVPWFRSGWPPDVAQRAAAAAPLPADVLALLERLKRREFTGGTAG